MNDSTIQSLNELNHRFYQAFAHDFDDSRNAPWPGWTRLLPHLDAIKAAESVPQVMDIGCGNGRFYKYLRSNWRPDFDYLGLDACSGLLERAPKSPAAKFEHRDVLNNGLPDMECTFVGAFGFFHHIPGFDSRRRMMEQMLACLSPGGIMAAAFWSFADKPRFEAKTLDWPADLQRESGDFILSWERGGLGQRYCHHVSPEEEDDLLLGLNANLVDRFLADGKSNDLNRYVVLQKI
jgi:tRNA (uracil-5-)-methyltransferase TRM9